jgi:hypothetical protein
MSFGLHLFRTGLPIMPAFDEVVFDLANRQRVGAGVGVSRNFAARDGGYAVDRE